MTERLQKILSARGVASRRAAETMIMDGRVTVNGTVAALGQTADLEKDEILLDGKPLPSGGKYVYILLHKPRGYVTTLSDEKGRKTAAELVADCGVRVYPVGRLDMDSEGLLLFTNDGEFANRLMHPKHEVQKTYLTWVAGFSETALEQLKQPIMLDGYRIQPPKVRVVKLGLLEITIHEGRNRQVRRMCDAAGMHVTRLKRIREGNLSLGDLPLGKWRYLTEDEVNSL
jgi:23S rRNA pseudouridine2605 synthase